MRSTKPMFNCFSRLMICLGALALTFSLGCAAKKTEKVVFLSDYNRLEADPMGDKGAMFWKTSDVDTKKYKKYILEQVSYFIPAATLEKVPKELKNDAQAMNTDIINKTTAYFEEQIKANLGPEFELVDQAGPDVARLRMVITSVFVNRKDLKAYQYIPVALALTGLAEATGNRDKVAVLSMEGQVLDSMTGLIVAEVVQQSGVEIDTKGITSSEDVMKLESFPNLDYWAQKLKERLLMNQQ